MPRFFSQSTVGSLFVYCLLGAMAQTAEPGPQPAPAYQSQKQQSFLVTAAMRENARRNVEKYPWAAERRDILLRKLRPYLAATDEQLWDLVPAPEIPRAGVVIKEDVAPPGAEAKHFAAEPQRTRGYGINRTRYSFDPFTRPWKIQSIGGRTIYPANDFAAYYRSGLDEFGRFHAGKADPQFLKTAEGPAVVDNGWGAQVNGKTYHFVAYYAFRMWVELFEATRDLAELYTLTGDPACAHKTGILLARIADVFPDTDTMEGFRRGIDGSTGVTGIGKMVGRIWDSFGAQGFSKAYDWTFDALVADQALADFVAAKKLKHWPSPISQPRDVVNHIEKNLIVGILDAIKSGKIAGNDGMPQLSMVTAALALNDPVRTPAALDWLFDAKGGDLNGVLIDRMNRDGLGIESGIGYQMIPPKSFAEVAMLLEKYTAYSRSDLFALYPKLRRGLQAGAAVKILDGATVNVGDGGAAMRYARRGYPMPVPVALKGYEVYSDTTSAGLLLDALNGNPEELPGDVYAADPEKQRGEVIAALQSLPRQDYQSFLSGGIGLGVLQAPSREHPRAIALNFGPMGWGGHGHGDRLSLHLFSHGSYMVTDLGYPTFTGAWPPRIGWVCHTVSHNTVMVDDQSMERRSSFSGKTQLFAEAGPVRVLDVDGGSEKTQRGQGHSSASSSARPIYPQATTYRRCLVMVDADARRSYYVDCFWVRGGGKHRLIQNGGGVQVTSSWPHWQKQAKGTLAGEDVPYGEFYDGPANWSYRGSGLMFLKDVERARPDQPFWVDWKILPPFVSLPSSANVHLRVYNLTPLQEAALANGEPPRGGPKELRYLVRTREGEGLASQFISVLEPYEQAPFIRGVRLLQAGDGPQGFAAALEVTLADGRRDILGITENGGPLEAPPFSLSGRIGWLRLAPDGTPREHALIDAASMAWQAHEFKLEPARYAGRVASIDQTDSRHVTVTLDAEALPADGKPHYLIVDSHQRSDAAFPIRTLAGKQADLGETPLDELLERPEDPNSPKIKAVAPGDAFIIPNFIHGTSAPPP